MARTLIPSPAAGQALDLIMGVRGMSNSRLAKLTGIGVGSVQKRRVGTVPSIDAGLLEEFGRHLNVPPALFHEDRASILAWFLEEAAVADDEVPTQERRKNTCTSSATLVAA